MSVGRVISITLTAAAAGDYAANDIISNSATGDAGVANQLTGFSGSTGGVVELDRISMVCSEDSVLFRPRIHWYGSNPAAADVEMDDNAVSDFAKTATGAAAYLGKTDLPAFADMGTAMAQTEVDNLAKLLKVGSSNTLYFVLQTLDAEANETANMTIRFDFYFRLF